MDAIEIPDYAVGERALYKLCEEGAGGLKDLEPKKRALESQPETCGQKNPRADFSIVPLEGGNSDEEKLLSTLSTPKNGKRPVQACFLEDTPPQKDEPPRKVEKRARATKRARTISAEEFDEKLAERIAKQETSQKVREAETKAKQILRDHSVDYTFVFQSSHKGLNIRGHWKQFLLGVAGQQDIECPRCQQIILDYKVCTVGNNHAFSRDKPDTLQPSLETAIVPYEPAPAPFLTTPPKRRSRAGRPRKGDAAVECEFNLLGYLSEKREGMYKFLDIVEATNRLEQSLKREPTANEIATEMKKHPVHCQMCGTFLHFPYLTNSLALSLGYFLKLLQVVLFSIVFSCFLI